MTLRNQRLILLVSAMSLGWDDSLPLAQKVEKLSPYFDPAPASSVEVPPAEIRDMGPKVEAESLRVWIRVSPPPGQCLTIRGGDFEDDRTVCKPRALAFTLAEMDRAGRLHWTIVTGPQDTGTTLTWQSPYRLAILQAENDKDDAPPRYRYIKACEADQASVLGRRIKVHFFGGEVWVIRLPEQDQLLPQPEPAPNLDVSSVSVKISDYTKDRDEWSLPIRDSYEMEGSMVMPRGSLPWGVKGRCRYRYLGPDEDPEVGRVECRDIDGYRSALLPLTCLRSLKPKA